MGQREEYYVENIDRAIEESLIRVFYQPIIRGSNGCVCSEEALARWVEPDGTMLYPDQFVPALEKAGLVHKLDLYMLESILADFDRRSEAGLHLVPVSVNLSRTDFDHFDMVSEVEKRVDASGYERSLIRIEITESVVGTDFEFMKEQIERFREAGFMVCMDDFGKGYSSLEFLQKVRFDALKFDLSFMQEFSKNDRTKVILTLLIRMAAALNIDTVAEGVETEEQFEFLKEAGCTKMQGFHFCVPIPLEEIVARYREGRQIGFENPEESEYYDSIGLISLFDLQKTGSDDISFYSKYFDVLPVAVIEYNGDILRVVRCNRSYKEFALKVFGLDVDHDYNHVPLLRSQNSAIFKLMEQSDSMDRRLMFEDVINGRYRITAYIRHSADNPVTGMSAYTVVILENRDIASESGVTFASAARALSSDYINLYYVDITTDDFIEYSPDAASSDLSLERHGHDFFVESARDAASAIYPGDRERFISEFKKENILGIIDSNGTYSLDYRLISDDGPVYVSMKAVSVDPDHIVIGVRNVDAYMRHKEDLERAREESITYSRITALAGNYIAIYTVDPKTDDYVEYSATKEYAGLGLEKTGADFFGVTSKLAEGIVHPEDLDGFRTIITRENVMRDIEQTGLFEFGYRMFINGEPVHVTLRAAMVEEKSGPRIIVGVVNIEDRVKRSQEYETSLIEARNLVNIDGLTGVKNKHAYLNAEEDINSLIRSGDAPEFAIVVLDLNGLKEINDAHGHQTGDNFLKAGCRAICEIFDHSPVFRVGGDEFAVIARGRDYDDIEQLLDVMNSHNERCIAKRHGQQHAGAEASDDASMAERMTIAAGSHDRDEKTVRDYSAANAGQIFEFDPDDIVIACGMARFRRGLDKNVADVFDRADLAMFENKKELKSR